MDFEKISHHFALYFPLYLVGITVVLVFIGQMWAEWGMTENFTTEEKSSDQSDQNLNS